MSWHSGCAMKQLTPEAGFLADSITQEEVFETLDNGKSKWPRQSLPERREYISVMVMKWGRKSYCIVMYWCKLKLQYALTVCQILYMSILTSERATAE